MASVDMETVKAGFGIVPSTALSTPERNLVNFPQTELDDLQTLVAASRVGPVTFESLQQDRKYGITTQWLHDAKQAWLNDFSW